MQFLSVFFGAFAVWALFYDYIVRGGDAILLTGEAWYALSPDTINLAQAVIERYIWPPLWGDVLLPVLQTPLWMFCAIVAVMFALLWAVAQRRRNAY